MTTKKPPSTAFLFWQTAIPVVVGVAAGFALLLFVNKPHAAALSNSLTTGVRAIERQLDGVSSSGIVPAIPALPALDRRMTLLVMGVDSNGVNTERWVGTRSDTMMLVSVDPVSKRVGLVSIPRDSRVRIPKHGTEKINAAHALGGPQLAVETVRNVFGIHVDRYVVIDTHGLKSLFAVLGPVEVNVENRMRYRDRAAHLDVDLEPGLQLLDPTQTEEYVRFRHDPRGDIGRIERQQWFLRQLAQKLKEPQVIFKLPQLFSFTQEYVVTDLSAEDMARLVAFGKDIDSSQVTTAMLPGGSQTINGGSYWLPDAEASKVVLERLIGPVLPPEATDQGLAGGVSGDLQPLAYEAQQSADASIIEDSAKPISVSIKYPRGGEVVAEQLEAILSSAGYKVRYKWQCPQPECQHDQIVQNSFRADDTKTASLREAVPCVRVFPTVVALESHPLCDFTIVISPATVASDLAYTPFGRHLEAALHQ